MSIIGRIRSWFGGGPPGGEAPLRAAGEAGGKAGDAGRVTEESTGPAKEMIRCEDALRLVQEYLDGELDGVSQERVKAHFDVCGMCYPHLRFEASFLEAVKRAGAGESAPEELRARVAALITEAGSEG